MCGIVAYMGKRDASKILLKGLSRLEYRGYDSAGIALINNGMNIFKKQGKVAGLAKYMEEKALGNPNLLYSNTGIAHTRWATHGEPNDANAHPHVSGSGRLALIHNGIIENYDTIKKDLIKKGYTFKSETDTEVLVQLIEDIFINSQVSLEEAVRLALKQVVGAYAIAVLDAEAPNQLLAARKGSPLVIGVSKGEFFVASDATPIIEYTNEVVYLNDFEIATMKGEHLEIKTIEDVTTTPYVQTLEMELEAIEKGGFEHFMLKEIFEQPRSVADSMRGRIDATAGHLVLGGLRQYLNKIVAADRIIILACGTSWHSALVAEYAFEEYTRIPVEVEYASEFRYRKPVIREGDVVFAISQSGETADTLAGIELAKSKGAIVCGICNVVGSSISRMTHAGAYTHAGPEIGVASTKAFTAQVVVLIMIALHIAQKRGTITESNYRSLLVGLEQIPAKIEKTLELNEQLKTLAQRFKDSRNFLYLGRGYNFPIALEGALKLKEISYIHAEGYPAAEMKHGPIALIDEEMPVVFIAPQDDSYEKVVSNIQEVKARRGVVIAIVTEGDTTIGQMADYTIEVPKTNSLLMPLVTVIPLQLLAYHIAVLRNCNVDQPRNLAKSVTVE